MVMGYHNGGKIECFDYDYKHKSQLERKNGKKKFFDADKILGVKVHEMHPLDVKALKQIYEMEKKKKSA